MPNIRPARTVVKELSEAPPPERLWLSLAKTANQICFLDSATRDGRLGRYSLIGWEPFCILQSRGQHVWVRNGRSATFREGDPFEVLRGMLQEHRRERHDLPVPFSIGAIGYLGYDLCHWIEKLPASAVSDINLPHLHLAFFNAIAVFDHATDRCYLVAEEVDSPGAEPPDEAILRLERALSEAAATRPSPESDARAAGDSLWANFSREGYLHAVERAREYIYAGDIFEVNLSQRFAAKLQVPPEVLYARLRQTNPAPFAGYIKLGSQAVLSSSPELFLRVRGRHVETRPIKGTRKRLDDEAADMVMQSELLASAKDQAELNMIIDLERNDLGRVCEYGTVRVKEARTLEHYQTVHHLVATIEGILRDDRDLVDLLKATFPGGSITGAPKIRAMEIIDELEPTRRSAYTGAMGYLGFDGTAELNIIIRSFIVDGDQAFFQVGGAVVADSDPQKEYRETLDKGLGLFRALGHHEATCSEDNLVVKVPNSVPERPLYAARRGQGQRF